MAPATITALPLLFSSHQWTLLPASAKVVPLLGLLAKLCTFAYSSHAEPPPQLPHC